MDRPAIRHAPVLRNLLSRVKAFAADRRGNVAVIAALAMPAVIGGLGLGTEVAAWYGAKRGIQNAADSAAIAAATNAGADFAAEARAVAASYGFVHGQDGATVTALSGQACPGGSANCYSVAVSRAYPLILAQVVGFAGDSTLNGSPAKRVSATAVAIRAKAPRNYCVVALGGSGAATALRSNGAPMADLSGCNTLSNTGATCNGHDLGADYGDAVGVNDGCGRIRTSNVDPFVDPYAALAANIPQHSCSEYNDDTISGIKAWSGAVHVCGSLRLTGPVVVDNTGDGAVLVIHNGDLDLNDFTLKTSGGSSLTIVFTGGAGASHIPTGGGTLDIKAPTSGAWSGVAMYQDPALTSGVNISDAGNDPTWNITGLVYLPHAAVTFSGAVNKSTNGASCFVIVADTLRINGTGQILAHSQCVQAGLEMPVTNVPLRGKLVS